MQPEQLRQPLRHSAPQEHHHPSPVHQPASFSLFSLSPKVAAVLAALAMALVAVVVMVVPALASPVVSPQELAVDLRPFVLGVDLPLEAPPWAAAAWVAVPMAAAEAVASVAFDRWAVAEVSLPPRLATRASSLILGALCLNRS